MRKKRVPRAIGLLLLMAPLLMTTGCGSHWLVLNPVGTVGLIEKRLIILTVVLSAIVVIPVILLLWYIVYRYRDTPDNKAPYRPEYSESKTLEIIWWGIPVVIVTILGIITVQKTFLLSRPPVRSAPPLTIQVMSLDWKWLFLYPGQQIATVNYCEIPTDRTVEFVLTSNAPMNSFWVPQLGGQEYTMPGMAMRLWLEADKPGKYFGSAANFSGEGFAHMRFNVVASPSAQFNSWVTQVKSTAPALTQTGYQQLVQPGLTDATAFSAYPPKIFTDTVYMEGGMYARHHSMSDSAVTGEKASKQDKTEHVIKGHAMNHHQMRSTSSHDNKTTLK